MGVYFIRQKFPSSDLFKISSSLHWAFSESAEGPQPSLRRSLLGLRDSELSSVLMQIILVALSMLCLDISLDQAGSNAADLLFTT